MIVCSAQPIRAHLFAPERLAEWPPSAGWPAGLGVCRPCFGGAASDPVPDSTMLRCSAVPAYLEKASGMVDDSVGRASAEARAKLALARK